MRVGWFTDPGNADGTPGGAELTMGEFANAAPDRVEIVDEFQDADRVVLGNVVTLSPDRLDGLDGRRVWWYHNDLSPHINPTVKGWLDENANHVFCSPLQRDRYGLDGRLVPPPIHLAAFRPNRDQRRKLHREGNVTVGSWQNTGKGQNLLAEWAKENGPVDVYGTGPFIPVGDNLLPRGGLDPSEVPAVLASYERFVHLPVALEPFGRAVAEAWAAGLEVVTNRMVGALWWINDNPDGLETAARDFWELVCE